MKRRYLKLWIEKALTIVFVINLIILGCIHDIYNWFGILIYLALCGNLLLCGYILSNYGKKFINFMEKN